MFIYIYIIGQIRSTMFNMIIDCVIIICSLIITYSHIYSHVILIMVVVKKMIMTLLTQNFHFIYIITGCCQVVTNETMLFWELF
jgi:hypothetical protein